MFYDKEVGVWLTGDDVNLGGGVIVPGELEYVASLNLDIQPYSSAQARMDYGFDIRATHTAFSPPFDYVVGMSVIEYNGIMYDITEKIEWDEYVEVIMNRRV